MASRPRVALLAGVVVVMIGGSVAAREEHSHSRPAGGPTSQPGSGESEHAPLGNLLEGSRVCDFINLADRSNWFGPDRLVSVDHSGRGFCNEVIQIQQTNSQPSVVGRIETWMAEDLSAAIEDVDGDGR